MRSFLPDYKCTKARSLSQALDLISEGARPLAGGTDIMVLLDAGVLPPGDYVDILELKELKGIQSTRNEIKLGALATYSQVRDHKLLEDEFPILPQSAREVGAIAIQNRGTIGGNIANGSPAADFPPGLLVYDAQIHLISKKGIRTLDYTKFHLGYKKSELQKDELIHSVSINRSFNKYNHFWRKVGSRHSQAISKTMIAAVVKISKKTIEDIRISFGSVAPSAIRCYQVENYLVGKRIDSRTIQEAKKVLLDDIQPIDDIRSSSKYRQTVSQNVLEEFLCGIG